MANIDFGSIVRDCLNAAKDQLGKSWNDFSVYAEHEFQQFAENAAFLANLKLNNQIDDGELQQRLQMQQLALKNVMLTIAGIGLITAQNLVNAILDIVWKGISTALGAALPKI